MNTPINTIELTPLIHYGDSVEYVDNDEGRTMLRCVVLHRAIGNLKLALCGSEQVPSCVQSYVRYCLEDATTDDLEPVMHFFDIYNHNKRFIHPNKRRYVCNVWNSLQAVFDGSMPDDPTFDMSDSNDNMASLWMTVKTKPTENEEWVIDTAMRVVQEETMDDDEDEEITLGSQDTWDDYEESAIQWMHHGGNGVTN